MNQQAFREAFQQSSHTPGIRKLRGILGGERKIADFCVPVNIGFPPPAFLEALQGELLERLKYYPSEPRAISEKFAAFLGLPAGMVAAGNGSTELFYNFLSFLGPGRRLLTCVPTFGRWTDAPRASGHDVVGYERLERNGFGIGPDAFVRLAREERVDVVVISNPNNPTGHLSTREELLGLIERLRREAPGVEYVVVDESFLDFSPHAARSTLLGHVAGLEKVIVLKSLGKSFGLHGTRMGVLVAQPRLVRAIAGHVPYWNVNGVAEGVIDLLPAFLRELDSGLRETMAATQAMKHELERVEGLTVFPTEANFVFVRFPAEVDPVRLRDRLLVGHDILVRSCGNKIGSDAHHFRIATRPLAEVRRYVAALGQEMPGI